jgi:hypothetical protein
MSDVILQNKLLLAHLCQAKSLIWLDPVKSFEAYPTKSETKFENLDQTAGYLGRTNVNEARR